MTDIQALGLVSILSNICIVGLNVIIYRLSKRVKTLIEKSNNAGR